jgi:PPM family protein phosphatase
MTPGSSHECLIAASLSDTGQVRTNNEDACFVDAERGLFIVSDGMGGALGGEVASKIVVEALPAMITERIARITESSNASIHACLSDAIRDLSQRVLNVATARIELRGMGATVVLVLIRDGKAHIANMGDSRAYLLRNERLAQLTADHSIVAILVQRGDITPEEAKTHPARSQLSRVVGMQGDGYPDVRTIKLRNNDRLMLCSDGLTNMLTSRTIAGLLRKHDNPSEACSALVNAANEAGGRDNISVVVISWKDEVDKAASTSTNALPQT